MIKLLLLSGALLTGSAAFGQATLYNTVSGIIWKDNGNSLRESGEIGIPGILVTLVDANTSQVVSSTISDPTGLYTLNNYVGIGDYFVNFTYPVAGFTVSNARVGSDNSINSSADPLTQGSFDNNSVSTDPFTISTSTNITNYGLGLVRIPTTVTYYSTQAVTTTIWSKNFRFPKSNNSAGTLLRATVFATDAAYHPVIGVENTGASSELAEIEGNGRLTLTPPIGTSIVLNTLTQKSQLLDAYDGITDYNGASGETWLNSYASNWSSQNVTGTNLNTYRTSTPDSLTIAGSTVGVTSVIGSGNLFANVETQVGTGVFVTYVYTTDPLPISLISFNAAKERSETRLTWEANGKIDDGGYEIERSSDGINFSSIGFVEATANGIVSYKFTDQTPLSGNNYYRLLMGNKQGGKTYSSTKVVTFGRTSTVTAFPNPADAHVSIVAGLDAQVSLLNINGQIVDIQNVRNGDQLIINTTNLNDGIYILNVTEGGVTHSQRITVRHQ